MNIIILPLSSNVVELLKKLRSDGDETLLDIESVLSFIFYAFSLHSDFSQALDYSIEQFKNDFLLNRPEITTQDVNNSLQNFKSLLIQLYLNLNNYNVQINDRLPYDFGSFLTESEIVLKKTRNLITRV